MNNILNYTQYINENRSDRVISAKDLLLTDFGNMLAFDGKWEMIFGCPSPNFTLAISGPPFSGKTTFLLEFAYYLATNFGKVLYISTEEFKSVTLKDKVKYVVKKLGIKSDDNKYAIPENLSFSKGMTDLKPYDFIIIDSISDVNLEIEDYKELTDIYDDKAFISVLQQTKAGDYRGTKEYEHEMDIFCKIQDGIITVTKNRFHTKSIYDYFNDKPIDMKQVENKQTVQSINDIIDDLKTKYKQYKIDNRLIADNTILLTINKMNGRILSRIILSTHNIKFDDSIIYIDLYDKDVKNRIEYIIDNIELDNNNRQIKIKEFYDNINIGDTVIFNDKFKKEIYNVFTKTNVSIYLENENGQKIYPLSRMLGRDIIIQHKDKEYTYELSERIRTDKTNN